MTTAARFTKWGLGLFLFGVFLSFGILGHYWHGASHMVGAVFKDTSPCGALTPDG